jgi:ATP-dependent Lon protease
MLIVQGHHFIRDQRVIDLLNANQERYVGLFLRKEYDKEADINEMIGNPKDVYKVGAFAQIRQVTMVNQGAQLLLTGIRRINLGDLVHGGPPTVAAVEHWKEKRYIRVPDDIKAYNNELRHELR